MSQNMYNEELSRLIFNCVEKKSELLIEQLANRAIRSFRAIKETAFASDDSSLEDLWDEYCFQCQSERSDMFDMYEDALTGQIELVLEKLQKEDKVMHNMVFLSYGAFVNNQIFDNGKYAGVTDDEVVTHILSVVRNIAVNYSNKRIAKALDY